MCAGSAAEVKGALYIMQVLFIKENSPSVLCATRIMISKGTLDIIKGLFMKEDSPTVMCAERSAEV